MKQTSLIEAQNTVIKGLSHHVEKLEESIRKKETDKSDINVSLKKLQPVKNCINNNNNKSESGQSSNGFPQNAVNDSNSKTVPKVDSVISSDTKKKDGQEISSNAWKEKKKPLIIGTSTAGSSHNNQDLNIQNAEDDFIAVKKIARKCHIHITRVNPKVDGEKISNYVKHI